MNDIDPEEVRREPPVMQHHAAPTCDGWWWVSVHGGEWQMKCVVGKTVWQNAQGESWRMSYSGWNARWVGPLLPPDTTEPAPDVHSIGYPETVENVYDDAALNMARHQGCVDGWRRGRRDMQAQIDENKRLRDEINRVQNAYQNGCRDLIATHQAQIDAAVADCEQRCATQLADYISRAADDERVRIDAAVAKEREACAKECERIVSGIGSATAAFPVRVCASQIRARSVKG